MKEEEEDEAEGGSALAGGGQVGQQVCKLTTTIIKDVSSTVSMGQVSVPPLYIYRSVL